MKQPIRHLQRIKAKYSTLNWYCNLVDMHYCIVAINWCTLCIKDIVANDSKFTCS